MNHANARLGAVAVALTVCALFLTQMSCDNGGGGSSSEGSTVTGQVETYSTEGAFFNAAPKPGRLDLIAEALSCLIASPAYAVVQGVSVSVSGTDLRSTTQADGTFVIFGVPAGLQTLIFSFNGTSASMVVDVPARSTIELENVRVSTSGVSVRRINVEADDNDNGNDDNDDNGNDDNDNDGNGNDDNGNDDNGNDDNGNDDNGNDDNGNDDNDN